MKITNIRISNFRGLTDLDFPLKHNVSVIVGPNAIGKSTILEAIRFTKAFLFPSYASETQEVLQEMRAWSPHTANVVMDGVAGDASKPLNIRLKISLTEGEFSSLNIPALATLHARNTHGIPSNVDETMIVQFFSSPVGQAALAKATAEMEKEMERLRSAKELNISLLFDPSKRRISGENLFDQEVAISMVRAIPVSKTLLSYFPADRAMPVGEIPIQLGMADMAEQSRAHIAQPAKKYQRLKHFIVNQFLFGQQARQDLTDDFGLIFRELLQGKVLEKLELTQNGLLSVKIKEAATGRSYDIDNMSSGEKGLILLFLAMRRTVHTGGVVLIDEPELHLNPAVCKKLLPFLMENVLKPCDAQAIICTHSPEILGLAFDREDCGLFHLYSGRDITPVYPHDKREVFEALKRLGVQTSDVLFTKGTIYVEGEHDVELLESGFGARIHGYKLAALGGRQEVEKEIKNLQDEAARGMLHAKQCFFFDLDRKPTSLASTDMVHVEQWDRYCFENYLLDSDAIYDACVALKMGGSLPTRGSLTGVLKSLALKQVKNFVAREECVARELPNVGLSRSEIEGLSSYEKIADTLASRLINTQAQLASFNKETWVSKFESDCRCREAEALAIWENKWEGVCDGKKLISDFYRTLSPRVPLLDFKKAIISQMAKNQSESWRVVESKLLGALS